MYAQRLFESGYPVQLLNTQYRMHPGIAEYPSQRFYHSKLQTCGELVRLTGQKEVRAGSMSRYVPYHGDSSGYFPPLLFHDLVYGREQVEQQSVRNKEEVQFIVSLYADFLGRYPSHGRNVGIIAPYRAQRAALMEAFRCKFGKRYTDAVEISTVDGFQGKMIGGER